MNLIACLFLLLFPTSLWSLPRGFIYLSDVDSSILQEMKYASTENFIGRPIAGYNKPICILTKEAALTLKKVQQKLKQHRLSLKVYDCYRPQVAVDDFIQWSQDLSSQEKKAKYYPRVNKADFFKEGYVATRSGHSRGSAVDLTIVNQQGELDMGTHFDFMDKSSHPFAESISREAKSNRLFLRYLMVDAGFLPISTEWWHFVLKNEPFKQKAFNFSVK